MPNSESEARTMLLHENRESNSHTRAIIAATGVTLEVAGLVILGSAIVDATTDFLQDGNIDDHIGLSLRHVGGVLLATLGYQITDLSKKMKEQDPNSRINKLSNIAPRNKLVQEAPPNTLSGMVTVGVGTS